MLNIAQLLLPISAAQSCGEDLSFSSEVDQIAQARQYDDPTLDQGAWVSTLKEADWDFVANRCAGMIESRSKDLRLAVWLAEAETRTRGLRGLGDGCAVLAGLCEHYWDSLYPQADDGDFDQRVGNLHWLLALIPKLAREIPETRLADAEYCLAMLSGLERVVDTQLGADGPGFSAARDAVQSVVRSLTPADCIAAFTSSGETPPGTVTIAPGGTPQNRAQALLQLRLVAEFFRRTEPHSPVAYLADKAASWGDMPLHVWLRAVIKDPSAIAGVEELLGEHTPRG